MTEEQMRDEIVHLRKKLYWARKERDEARLTITRLRFEFERIAGCEIRSQADVAELKKRAKAFAKEKKA